MTITLNRNRIVAGPATLVRRNGVQQFVSEYREYAYDGTLLRWWTALGVSFVFQ